MKRPIAIAIMSAALSLASLPWTARAETGASSWSKRVNPATKPRRQPRPQGDGRTASRRRTPPAPGQSLRSTLTPSNPLGSTFIHPTGKDAAYIAFEQGQYLTALKLATAQAEKNDPQAHTLLGRLYSDGLGVPRDIAKAADWYRRGAKLGDPEAMFALGVILVAGRGIKKDQAGAARMFEQAARKGHAAAHYNLALLFLSGKGKPENPFRAAQHLEYAARKGLAEAQYDLAALYQNGHGVKANAYQAALWLRRAAKKGLPAAQFEYAVALLRGRGLNVDKSLIVEYLTAAANAGVGGAQNRLAHVYAIGIPGTRRDPVAAAKWHMIARTNGVDDKALDALVAKLPAKLRRKALRAAEEHRTRSLVGLDVR